VRTLWEHAEAVHQNELASELKKNLKIDFRRMFAKECAQEKPTKDDSSPRKPNYNDANAA